MKGSKLSSFLRRLDLAGLGFKLLCIVILLFLISPIAIIVSTAFTAGKYVTFPPEGFSFQYFISFFKNSRWVSGLQNSLLLATIITIITVGVSIPAAVAFRRNIPYKGLLFILIMLPFFVPPLLTAVSMLVLHNILRWGRFASLITGHALWAITLVFLTIRVSLFGVDRTLEDVARVLGASRIRTFFEITLPLMKNGVVAGSVFAFLLSLNEFIIAYFVATASIRTLPLLIWSGIRVGLDPLSAVSSVVIIIISFILFGTILKMIKIEEIFI